MGPPKTSRGATRKAAGKSIADIELESKRSNNICSRHDIAEILLKLT